MSQENSEIEYGGEEIAEEAAYFGESGSPVGPPPASLVGSLLELLQHPSRVAARCHAKQGTSYTLRLALGALFCFLVYGSSAGFFQGAGQIWLSGFKIPLIIVCSLLLCAPSFYVFSALGGATLSLRGFVLALTSFGALLGLLLVGFLPISWLFTVSSRSLLFLIFFHLVVWLICLGFAGRFLRLALQPAGGWNGRFAWLCLVLLVSLQMTTFLRPVLWQPPETSLFQTERMSFFEHLGKAAKVQLLKLSESEDD